MSFSPFQRTLYATEEELEARLSVQYDTPSNATQLIEKASELIDEVTMGRAQGAWDDEDSEDNEDNRRALSRAVCDQVEFWVEVSESHDVAGLTGSLVAGRVQIHPVARVLSNRARRTLRNAGLLWLGVSVR
jgi:hypothetical protein